MGIFITKEFARFARKEGISNITLREVVEDLERGKVDADYGGHVVKQRISCPNEGKSGGYRVIVIYRKGLTTHRFVRYITLFCHPCESRDPG